MTVKIAIIGGGIGGMTLALSLLDAGFDDVDIFESSSTIMELGVGIMLQPHAVRELSELGLLDELLAVGIPPTQLAYYTKLGQLIWSEPRGLAAGYSWPTIAIHRGQLLGILHRAVLARLGGSHVHTGHHLADFGQHDSVVWGEFVDRTTRAAVGSVETDLLVGCDGIHSVLRQTLYADEGPPLWNGVIMCRGVTVCRPLASARTSYIAGYSGRQVVVFPISKRHEDKGEALINWVAKFKSEEGQPMSKQDWDHTARLDEVLAPFSSFVFDFLDIPALVRGAETIYQYPMVDRDPLPTWDFGRVTLLGDAAHPMYPQGGNGASQAIVDARVLARELALQPTVEAAVAAYDGVRRPATAAVVLSNRRGGPERVQDIVEERAPNGFANLDDVISLQEMEEIIGGYKRITGADRDALNQRPSLSVPRYF
jgi:2-polyprenyl-6-methoxyphenol hydroxylase-like FAD-dependent oxidoreductase